MKSARGDDGKIDWESLVGAGGTSLAELGRWSGHQDGICVRYATGGCFDQGCKADHCNFWECPKEWQAATTPKLKQCVAKLKEQEAAADANGGRG